MVLQIAAHPLAVQSHGDALVRQPLAGTYAGELQDPDRADRAGRQDHLAPRPRFVEAPALAIADARRPQAVQQHGLGEHPGLEPQVRPVQHRLQEAPRGRPSQPALLVHMEGADTGVVAGVEVGRRGDAHLVGRPGDRVQHIPVDPRRLDPPLAPRAVMLAVAEEMVVQPPEGRQHIVPAPAGQAELAPMVIVGRLAAHGDHGVDRRGAADHPAAGIVQGPAVQPRLGLGPVHPVRARIADGEQVADGNVEPHPVVLAAGLQQQHPGLGILRQAIGQDAARRSGAHDDIVVLALDLLGRLSHGLSSRARAGLPRAEGRSRPVSRRPLQRMVIQRSPRIPLIPANYLPGLNSCAGEVGSE